MTVAFAGNLEEFANAMARRDYSQFGDINTSDKKDSASGKIKDYIETQKAKRVPKKRGK